MNPVNTSLFLSQDGSVSRERTVDKTRTRVGKKLDETNGKKKKYIPGKFLSIGYCLQGNVDLGGCCL